MLDFFITDSNLNKLKADIKKLDFRFKNHQEYFKQAGEIVREQLLKSFESDGLPIRWVDLSPRYLASHIKMSSKYPTGVLKLTGAMMASFVKLGSSNNIQKIGRHYGIFGSSDPKAVKHYSGIGVPKRNPIQHSTDLVQILTKQLVDFIAGRKI